MQNWHALDKDEVLRELKVDVKTGLTSATAQERQQTYGKNEFAAQKKDSLFKLILHQLSDISIIILLIAAGLSFAMALQSGEGFLEPIVIMGIIVMNLILAITQEQSAERALEALSELNNPFCLVVRDGAQQEIATAEVVPGDIILLKPGDLVPADARLLESASLAADESALTGESEAAEKDALALPEGHAIPLGDQNNMVFSGCLITAGRATAVITATGMQTQMGHIAGYLNNKQKIKTPLQKRLDKLGKTISTIAVVSAIFLLTVGILQGESFWDMMLLAVALAVAAVPETLALIVTLSLSHGVKNMVRKNALIRKLPAVETLGNTSIICSDKTGTLTQNRMAIKRLWQPEAEPFEASATFTKSQTVFLEMLALASNAKVEKEPDGAIRIIGDPTESAIMRLLTDKGIDKADLERNYPKVAEIPFSSARKIMTVILQDPQGGYLVLTKGAIDRLPVSEQYQETAQQIQETHDLFAANALRVIAMGSRRIDELPAPEALENIERDLTFNGIIGLIDPPRPEAAPAVARAKQAGIRTIMITGDHAVTAGAIARDIGILGPNEKVLTGAQMAEMSDDELCNSVKNFSVYARVSPEDKIRIVEAWQENGEVVSMTGDGVNDAPALKAADVGVAMGQNGTEVAKNASDMVLTDDNFATIIDSVEEGRNVYSNIRKTIYFLLVCNISEIIVVLLAQLQGWGIPVTPVMLLLINVIGDGIPGLHLAKETSDPRIMARGPIRREESFFDGMLHVIIRQTVICSLVVLIAYYVGCFVVFSPDYAPAVAIGQTMAFLVLGWTSILHIFTVRSRQSIFKRSLRDNPSLVISAVAMLAVFTLLVAFPSVGYIFGLTAIGIHHWLLVIGLSLLPTVVAEIGKVSDNYILNREMRQHRNRLMHHYVKQDDVV